MKEDIGKSSLFYKTGKEKENVLNRLPKIMERSLETSEDYPDFLRIYKTHLDYAIREEKADERVAHELLNSSLIDAFALNADPYAINLVFFSQIAPINFTKEFVYYGSIDVLKTTSNLHKLNFKKAILEDLKDMDPLTYSNFVMLESLDEKTREKIGNKILEKYGENTGLAKYVLRTINYRLENLPKLPDDFEYENLTDIDKVKLILVSNQSEWVKPQHVKKEFEMVYGEPIKLSNVSTYLGRLYDRDKIMRRGSRAQREYKLSKTVEILTN